MKLIATATALCLGFACASAVASEPTEKDAIAMAERAAVFFKAHGKEGLKKAISEKNPDFSQGSLYIDMRDIKTGIVLAHPHNPSIVGKDLTDVPDANGKKSGKIEPKTTYILRIDDFCVEAGLYKK
jgi:hypothetical protein